MKKCVGAAAVLFVVALAILHFFNAGGPAPPMMAPATLMTASQASMVSSTNAGSNSSSTTPLRTQAPAESIPPQEAQTVPDTNAAAEIPPEIVLQNVGRMVRQYGEMFGGNPVGTNPEITSQLSGENPKHINFITAQAGMRVNSDGELVDAWGTPYFFHQISGSEMEIHSAGPDKIMWTSDDLVIK
jgi:hypothetical protein